MKRTYDSLVNNDNQDQYSSPTDVTNTLNTAVTNTLITAATSVNPPATNITTETRPGYYPTNVPNIPDFSTPTKFIQFNRSYWILGIWRDQSICKFDSEGIDSIVQQCQSNNPPKTKSILAEVIEFESKNGHYSSNTLGAIAIKASSGNFFYFCKSCSFQLPSYKVTAKTNLENWVKFGKTAKNKEIRFTCTICNTVVTFRSERFINNHTRNQDYSLPHHNGCHGLGLVSFKNLFKVFQLQ
ncbi:hypothetical protein ACTFIW_001503 [Dictyostelium discoideum]